jgi:ferredoxin
MTVYRIEIDRSLCSGFGACVRESETFRLENGIAVSVGRSSDPRVLDAAAACPMSAVLVYEEDAA